MISASDLRKKFIAYFRDCRGHREIKGASLLPENDPTVLFTTAGMHPLVPYLMGEQHPEGTRLVDVQKCIRTGDIDEVGDASHLTFFEMLGNWSLGDYFKGEAIWMSYEFLTDWLKIDPKRLMVTCFKGDADAPRDEESAAAWKSIDFKEVDGSGDKQMIFFYEKKKNWWGPAGETGPCGPDTEMFYDHCPELPSTEHKPGASEAAIAKYPYEGGRCHPNCECGRYVEIWNDVFMQFNKTESGTFEPLAQKNVDTGMGFERVLSILNGVRSPYETELFVPVMERLRELASEPNEFSLRVVADHVRAATFILGDDRGIPPSNNDQGYVLRKIIRRAIRHGKKLGIEGSFIVSIAKMFIEINGDFYTELCKNEEFIVKELQKEEEQFLIALGNGEQEIAKDVRRVQEGIDFLKNGTHVFELEMGLNGILNVVSGPEMLSTLNDVLRPILKQMRMEFKGAAAEKTVEVPESVRAIARDLAEHSWKLRGDRAFHYFEAFGFPLEMTVEIMADHGIEVEKEGFETAFTAHQEKSRAGSAQKFAGGLADHSEETKRLHTATHLMLEALRRVLGKHVEQKGSNITAERLRFDFNHPDRLTPEQIAEVEKIVNDAIQADYPVSWQEMTVQKARDIDATGVFIDKYEGELEGKVKVYTMGTFSKEICGGPHVDHTGQLGKHFKIVKEESVASGIRRIKAVLEN